MTIKHAAAGLACLLAAGPLAAEGYLAGKVEKLPDLIVGQGDAGYGVSQKDFNLVTGKGYRLKIASTGNKPCAWHAPEFLANIYVRKIEVNKVEIKTPTLHEIEMEEEGAADLYFVVIKPGEYTWRCEGTAEKGVTGKFIVK